MEKKIDYHCLKDFKFANFIVIVIILLICECFFFRNILGNNVLIGDRGDGRLTTLLAEHWYNFFCGNEKFTELSMFFPTTDVIGYTDLLLGYGLIHSIFRILGFDMFISYKLTLILIHFLGTVSMYYLLKRKLNLDTVWALFGTIAFSFSNAYSIHLGHTQLAAVSTLPILTVLLIGFLKNINNRKKRNLYACLFIVLFALLTYTSWYIAYFTGLFSLVFIVLFLIKSRRILKELGWEKINDRCKQKKLYIDLIGCFILLFVLYIPFIRIYLPVLEMSNGYSYEGVSWYLPEFIDLFNVSENNFLFGRFVSGLGLSERPYNGENIQGYSYVLIITFITAYCINRSRKTGLDSTKEKVEWNVIRSVFLAVIICVLTTIKLSSNGVSLWSIVYHVIPMSKSIRAVPRFLLWLSFPISVITAYVLNSAYQKTKLKLGATVLTGLLFVSNIINTGVNAHWNAADEQNFITSVSAPPESMESFYIIDSKNSNDPSYIYQLDAFEIANYYHTKTINGYSGQIPSGWNDINDPSSERYENSVFEWVKKYQLSDVYAYDRGENVWIPLEERINLYIQDIFQPSENKFSVFSGLMDTKQGDFAWTSQDFKVQLVNSQIQETGLVIKMSAPFSSYFKQNPDITPQADVYIDGEYVQSLSLIDGYAEYRIPMKDHASEHYDIQIKTNVWFNPKQIGLNDDARNLSLAMYYIGPDV